MAPSENREEKLVSDAEALSSRRRIAPKRKLLSVRELVIFAMLGALLFGLELLMEILPNIHPVGVLTMVYTVVFRKKALYPIGIFILLNGLYAGFAVWWLPYLYLFPLLWGMTMLIPRRLPRAARAIIYPALCALHGLLFGTLYAPAWAMMFSLSFEETLLWVAAGIPFDVIHAVGNLCLGLFILPLSELMKKLVEKRYR